MIKISLFLLFQLILILNNKVGSERILCIFPTNAKSHYSAFEPLALELAKKGHELVIINSFPQKKPVKNIRDIDVSEYFIPLISAININELLDIPTGTINELTMMTVLVNLSQKVFENPEVKNLLNSSDEKFDLVIAEMFNTDMYLGFAQKFNTSIIGFTFSTILPWVNARFSNPDNPSYIPSICSQFSYKMDFLQRVSNSLQTFIAKLLYKFRVDVLSEYHAKGFFGEDIPPLQELAKKSSLLLFNSHFTIHGARPLMPGVIEVGGLHIPFQASTLPKDLEKFINESSHGVIYFCMGSMLKASTLPEEKRLDLIEVFSKLPQRVLWKWETETMPDKPDNVKLLKWMPQRDVLAHPNIKIFISHGGLLGTTEAVYSGVPIIGMPFYGDQAVNVEAVQAAGAGIRLDFKNLNKETLENAIRRILDDPKYKENAKQLSERFRDRPQSPLETAIYWTEYVIRHKGAPHLRSAAVDLTWYQYLLLDVVAFIIFILIVTVTILYYSIKFIYNLINKVFSKPQKNEKRSKHKDD
ncbi:UDP-glycosyltransferase UGT5-like isoform X2 [Lycorma delicatula]|uniref:UDP-glycosyltransferase UGT5-like isoform X2 n=1 Tax=Lycorma delicatula TaxID=130591 RepID=UPI003F511BB1